MKRFDRDREKNKAVYCCTWVNYGP